MKEVIDHIIQIDKLAYDNKTKNESKLLRKKQSYEETVSAYKKEKLETAKKNAEIIAEKMETVLKNEEEKQLRTISKISVEIDKRYKETEKQLIEKLLNKLFVMEG